MFREDFNSVLNESRYIEGSSYIHISFIRLNALLTDSVFDRNWHRKYYNYLEQGMFRRTTS